MGKTKTKLPLSQAKKRVRIAREAKRFGIVGAALAFAFGFLQFARVEGRRTAQETMKMKQEWALKEAENAKREAEHKAKIEAIERENEKNYQEKLVAEEKLIEEKRREGFLPRYYVDPKTGQTIRDFAKVYTNEIPQTNSPAVSPKNKTNSTNSIEREQRELKEKSSPTPSLQAPNYSGFSTYGGLSPSSARLNALTAAKARSKKAYSGLRVARARRKG